MIKTKFIEENEVEIDFKQYLKYDLIIVSDYGHGFC